MKAILFLLLSLSLLSATETFLSDSSELSLEQLNDAMFNIDLLGSSLPCTICDKVVGFAVGKIAKSGCGFLLKIEMAAVCEAAGLGPEDPLADVCVVTLVGACGEIAKLIADKITNPTAICNTLHICT